MRVKDLIAELEKMPQNATVAVHYMSNTTFIPARRVPVRLVEDADPWEGGWYGLSGQPHGTNRRDTEAKTRRLVVVG